MIIYLKKYRSLLSHLITDVHDIKNTKSFYLHHVTLSKPSLLVNRMIIGYLFEARPAQKEKKQILYSGQPMAQFHHNIFQPFPFLNQLCSTEINFGPSI